MLKIEKWDIYWRLTIIKEVGHKWEYRIFQCKCECWNIKEIRLSGLRNWNSQSCGCLLKNKITKHWMKYTRIYNIWCWIKKRCTDKNIPNYKDYGGRWITYDKKRQEFEWFYEDMKEWYSDNLSIDRINNDWNYSKKNCRWSSRKQQSRNMRSNVVYKWKCIAEWIEELGINRSLVYSRIRRGWVIERALGINK